MFKWLALAAIVGMAVVYKVFYGDNVKLKNTHHQTTEQPVVDKFAVVIGDPLTPEDIELILSHGTKNGVN